MGCRTRSIAPSTHKERSGAAATAECGPATGVTRSVPSSARVTMIDGDVCKGTTGAVCVEAQPRSKTKSSLPPIKEKIYTHKTRP